MIKILFIDDNADYLNLCIRFLTSYNIDVDTEISPSIGFSRLIKNEYDYVFIDWVFAVKEITGRELLDYFKDNSLKTKIYILSEYDPSEIRIKLNEFYNNVVDIVPKYKFIEFFEVLFSNTLK